MRSFTIAIALVFMCPVLTSCAASEPIDLKIVLPNGFHGFGAIYDGKHTSADQIGRFELVGNTATASVDFGGGVNAESLDQTLRARGFRPKVYFESGTELPLNLSSKDSTEGVRFWLLPMPPSRAVYFFVGTIDDVISFMSGTKEIYKDEFSPDAYFLSRRRKK